MLEAISFLHVACHQLSFQSLGTYLPVAGNVGVFCHYEDEYVQLIKMRERLTEPSDNPNQKYFKLHKPIVISVKDGIPAAVYTHLYIRKPDPYRAQVGDVDFILDSNAYADLKQELQEGEQVKGVRLFERPELDMIELYDPDADALAYVSIQRMTEKVRVK